LLFLANRVYFTTAFLAQAAPQEIGKDLDKKIFVINDLSKILPDTVQPLTADQEEKTSEVFARYYGVKQ
jgi:hypothetical protein